MRRPTICRSWQTVTTTRTSGRRRARPATGCKSTPARPVADRPPLRRSSGRRSLLKRSPTISLAGIFRRKSAIMRQMLAANQVGATTVPGGRSLASRYELAERIGGGGEGDTFVAIDRTNGERVAVKLFHAAPAAVERRVRYEFARLAGLNHPGVVRV